MKARLPLSFDPEYFKNLAETEGEKSPEEIFTLINKRNHWSANSRSGSGSDDMQTEVLRQKLPGVIKDLNLKTFLDLPCGDFNWMHGVQMDIDLYIGGDIVKAIIDHNQEVYANANRKFMILDIIHGQLPAADMLFCRDCLVHFSFADIQQAISNIKRSNIQYLMTTTFTACTENTDITTGDWRVINLQIPPFNFPEPILLINEGCTEGAGTYNDKCMGVWRVEDLSRIPGFDET